MLNYLIKEYGMNTKSLSKVLDIESSFLDNFEKNKNKISLEKRGGFSGTLSTLYYISKISPDERNRAVLDVLTEDYNIDIETIARMAKVCKDDVERFRVNSDSITDAVKYKIATVSLFLHFMFKPNED